MRLKPGAKVFLTLVVLFLIGFGALKLGWLDSVVQIIAPDKKPVQQVSGTDFQDIDANAREDATPDKPADAQPPATPPKSSGGKLNRPIRVGIVLYGGFAGGLLANQGKPANAGSVFAKKHGVQVELVQIDDMVELGNAFRVGGDADGIDLMATTTDMFAMQYGGMLDLKPVTIIQTDWSRGADAIAVAKGISNVSQLKGKKVAVAEGTPSHFLLLYVLSQAGLSQQDIKPVFTTSSIDAALAFKAAKVDACVSWSPDVYIAAAGRPGASILASTREATSLLGGTIVARGDFAAAYPQALDAFVAGWLEGVQMVEADPEAAAQVLVQSFDGIKMEDANGMLADVKLANAEDNRRFFELDGDSVAGYDDLYTTASKIWKKIGLLDESTRPDLTRNTGFVSEATEKLAGKTQPQTKEFEFTPPSAEVKKSEPIVTKRISVYFQTGSSTLDPNAKMVLQQAAELAQTFGSAYIRVSGNTDSVGGRQMNIELSRKRAQAVVDYLVKEFGFPRDKFVVEGNGPDKPVASNDTAEGKAKNRRTDFEVVPQPQQ
jgi:NitT/TauT family transport system substrate-binding protein